MKVCIAEKPSVAKEIAGIIGATQRKDGYYEGNGYQVTWTFGHLCTLKEPNDYHPKWKYWDLHSLPILPQRFSIKVIEDQGIKKQFSVIERLLNDCEEVINCGDAGQEGELIQRWVLSKAKFKKKVRRLWISSLTEEAIKEGFQNLRSGEEFDNLYAAGSSRAIGDWLLGMNATRLYTVKYGRDRQVLSIGRVQTPTLALIVQRQHEMDRFRSETYWEVKTIYRDVLFSSNLGKIKQIENGQASIEKIKEAPFTIISFVKKEGKEHPPRLFDLTALQVECNKKFGFSADQTLKLIQSLYEKKFVTYPRVDTSYLPNDVYPKIPGILKGLTYFSRFTESLLSNPIRKSKKVFDDKKVTDHHAIIPTGINPSGITPEEQKVYHTITKRFLSVFYPDCIVSNTTVLGKVTEIEFKATGKQILDPGWRIIYNGESDDDDKDDDKQVMPVFEEGESGSHDPQLEEKKTQSPKYYSEATLLRAMETAGKQVEDEELREIMKDNGIGRPSTRAAVIETLFRRNYIQKDKKRLIPTQIGIELIGVINNELLKSAELTGQWEKKLREIEKGTYEVSKFRMEMYEMIQSLVEEVLFDKQLRKISTLDEIKAAEQQKKTVKKKPKANICPKCQKGNIVKGKTAFGCSSFKEGCDFRVSLEYGGKKLSDNQLTSLLKSKKTSLIKGFKKGTDKIDGFLILKEDYKIGFELKEKELLHCPKCKSGTMVEGRNAFGCSEWKNGCKTLIPFEFKGKKITESVLEQLLLKGKTTKLKGFDQLPEGVVSARIQFNSNFELELGFD